MLELKVQREVGLARYLIHLHFFFFRGQNIFFERVPETAAERDSAKVIGSLSYRNFIKLPATHKLILNFLFSCEKYRDRSTANIYT